ncbi:MAG TPA: RNA polymerase sigma factor [Gammaproteobacteria bacterium]
MPDHANFEQLYRSHYRRVRGLCRQLLGRADSADDAAQEAFMRAYRAFDRYDPAQPFAAWIMTIASRYCIDVVRRRAKEAQLFGDEDVERVDHGSEEATTLDALVASERAEELKAAIASLPDKHRIPLVLAYFEDASYDEIAAVLGVTRNHVGVLILRAKQALRRTMQPQHEGESK